MVMYLVHFINAAGADIYIKIVDLEDAKELVNELRLLKIPAGIIMQYRVIPE